MSRSSHSSAPTSVASGALHVAAHAAKHAVARPIAKAPAMSATGEQAHQLFRAARESAALSQSKAATVLGIAIRTLQRWERNECPVPAWALIALQRRARRAA